jgi:hypothetical protein
MSAAGKKYQPTTFSPSHFRRSLSGVDLTELEYRILVEMCEHTQVDKPVVTIGSPRLALLCGSRPESVRNCWRRLKAKGFIYPVGRHGGGNKVDRWRLIDNGVRTNPDGQPLWDPKGWDAGVYCESAQRCQTCGQPSSMDAQPSSTTLSTVIPDALNRNPGITRSSYEVERSNYEVDAYASGATRSPNGDAPRPGAAREEQKTPTPVNDEFIVDFISISLPWPEWIEGEEDRCGEPIPVERPEGTGGRADRIARQCWDELRNDWQEAQGEISQAVDACPYRCANSAIPGTFSRSDGTVWWCHHQAPWPDQVADFLGHAAAHGYQLPAALRAELEALKRSEADAKLVDDVHAAVLAVHGASAAAYAANLVRQNAEQSRTIEHAELLQIAIDCAARWIAENEAAAARAAEVAQEEAELAAYDLEVRPRRLLSARRVSPLRPDSRSRPTPRCWCRQPVASR